MSGTGGKPRRPAAGSDRVVARGTEAEAGTEASVTAGAESEETFYCDLCGHAMLNLHCKLICEQCGYKRDCSDP